MKLNQSPRLNADPDTQRVFKEIATQVNLLSEGKLAANYSALTAAPTAGSFAVGDFVKNSAPSELGSASSKYVIFGWMCLVAGTPGTFVQCRFLTGN